MLASVVIPMYGQGALTRACLRSLAASTAGLQGMGGVEVLLADNGAADFPDDGRSCAELGRALFGERFRYLPQAFNRNFAGGCNAGAAEAQGRHVCFLNNDTTQEAGWLARLLDALAADAGLRAVGPLLLYPPAADAAAAVQHLGVTLGPDLRLRHLYEHFPATHRVTARARRLRILTGAALLLDKALFLRLGGFDEAFRNGFEDVELCKRLGETGGAAPCLACVPDAVVWHLCGRTPGRNAHEDHNRAVLAERGAHAFFSPDEHRCLAEDGYVLRLTPWLTWQPGLPPAQEARLFKRLREARGDPAAKRAALAGLVEEEPWLTAAWDELAAGEPDPARALALALRATRFDMTPAPLLHVRRLARQAGLADMAARAQQALERFCLSRAERVRRLRGLRPLLRARCPELADEPDRALAGEEAFHRNVYLSFAEQVRYGA